MKLLYLYVFLLFLFSCILNSQADQVNAEETTLLENSLTVGSDKSGSVVSGKTGISGGKITIANGGKSHTTTLGKSKSGREKSSCGRGKKACGRGKRKNGGGAGGRRKSAGGRRKSSNKQGKNLSRGSSHRNVRTRSARVVEIKGRH